MSTWRVWMRVMFLAGGVAAGGCADHGTYQVSWQFAGADPNTGCGEHGVDSIRVIGRDSAGDNDNFVALCTAYQLSQSVPVGTWTFEVHQIDVRGVPIDPKDDQGNLLPPTATGDVIKDQPVWLDPMPVQLTPRPACSDGIDNDGDGRVDLDDPDCAGDPNGTSEAPQ
jgi:hypothetical protein